MTMTMTCMTKQRQKQRKKEARYVILVKDNVGGAGMR